MSCSSDKKKHVLCLINLETFKPKEALGEEKKERVRREAWKRSVSGTGKIGQRDGCVNTVLLVI